MLEFLVLKLIFKGHKKNDIFQIVYDKFVDDDGEVQKNGDIVYAYMKNRGKEIAL